ncbi:hypothetical protein HDV63DRAFT_380860 [Trichoderma sp. SZMC 28014]
MSWGGALVLAVQYMYMLYVPILHAAELVPTLAGRAQAYARPSIVYPQEPTCIVALWPGRKISYLAQQRGSSARRRSRRRGHSV